MNRICKRYVIILTIISVLIMVGCARVNVVKIPTPTQYINEWTDADQRKADAIEGFRFYLPRPYVNVTESFPIYSEVYIAEGAISPDGKYAVITKVRSNSSLSEYFASNLQNVSIPNTLIRKKDAGKEGFKGQSGDADDITSGSDSENSNINENIQSPEQSEDSQNIDNKTGVLKKSVTNDNGAFAYQPMRGSYDIAYLPDFEEQYAIESKANLGNAEFAVNFGQGWSLQGFNSLSDNSQLNSRIFDILDSASAVAKAKLKSLQGKFETPKNVDGNGFAAQEGGESLEGVPGTIVSLKVSVIYYASKGLYPILKPRELKIAKEPKFNIFGDITQKNDSFTVPMYPYQHISFNTFKVIAVEAINPTENAYDKVFHPTGYFERDSNPEPGKSHDNSTSPGVTGPNSNPTTSGAGDSEPQDTVKELSEFITKLDIKKASTIFDDENGNTGKVTAVEPVPDSDSVTKIILHMSFINETMPVDDINMKNAIREEIDKSLDINLEKQMAIVPSDAWRNSDANEKKLIQKAICLKDGDVDSIWGPNTLAKVKAKYKNHHGVLTQDQKAALIAAVKGKTDEQIAIDCGGS